ncbi:MAG: hypothetical protein WKG07_28360 [Hymenobacter sp.]
MAVAKGNNLLRSQLLLALLAAVLVVGGVYLLVPPLGIVGAGITLVLAEVAATIGYQVVAQRWLRQNGLRWPHRHFLLANVAVVIALLALGALVLLPAAKWVILPTALLLLTINLWRYWLALPELATQNALRIISNLPGIRKLYFFAKA